MKLSTITLLSIIILSCVETSKTSSLPKVEQQKEYTFDYSDISNFRKAYERIELTGDTLAAIESYFEEGSEGMRAWIKRYNYTPQRMVAAISKTPKYYKSLTTIDKKLIRYEDTIVRGLKGIKALYPSEFVHLPPIYYFVLFSGGGSVEMTATMMSVDYYGLNNDIDKTEFEKFGGLFPQGSFPLEQTDQIPHVVIHETAHLLQAYIQGELDYISIYTEDKKRTMLAYAIREGGADYLTFLGSGLRNERMHTYGDAHEEELWNLFRLLLSDNPDNHPGWFSGQSKHQPDWPWQIGYYLGFKMVEHYYNQSTDKEEALTLILSANEESVFHLIVEKYDQKWVN